MSNKLSLKQYIFRLLFSTAIILSLFAWPSFAFSKEIHVAAQKGNLNKVKTLLKANPDLVNAKDGWGYTPLHWAAYFGHLDVAELLLANGADINQNANDGTMPLHKAVAFSSRSKDVVQLLLAKGADINAKDKDGLAPLHFAARGRDKNVAELLLAKGADVNAKDKYGVTPLHFAAKGHKDIAEILLAKGADVNAKDKGGATPLDVAVGYDRKDMVELLLEKGADVNAKTNYGETPLHHAAMLGRKDVTELLLSKGADINAKNDKGETPLHFAASLGHKDVAELLLAKGADVTAKDKDDVTRLYVTKTQICREIDLTVDNVASGHTSVGPNEQLCLRRGFEKAGNCEQPLRSRVPGLELMRKDDLVCVAVPGKRPLAVKTGWLPVSHWKRDPDAAPPEPQAWAGVWQNERARLNITVTDNRVNIDGHAIWSGRLSPHFGNLNFEGIPDGDRLENQEGEECRGTLRRIGNYIIAKDNGKCGGMNVSFSGVYRFRPGLQPKAPGN